MIIGRQHDPKTHNEIPTAIKNGMTQTEAGKPYSISPKTISTWCRQDVLCGDKNYITQINQFKRELDNAYRVICKLSTHADRPKD